MSSSGPLDIEVRYLDAAGTWSIEAWGKVDGSQLARSAPARRFPTYKGQRNYPGLL